MSVVRRAPVSRPPRRTAPGVDLRLWPPALCGWASCLVCLLAPAWVGAVLGAGAVVGAVAARSWARGTSPHPGSRGHQTGRHARAAPGIAAGVCLCLGVVALVCLVTLGRAQHRDQVLGLLPPVGSVEVDLTVLEDPRPGRAPSWGGPPGVRVPARLEVATVDGRRTRTGGLAVVVLADGTWGELPLGARLRVRTTPVPTGRADPAALLLRVEGPPRHLGPPVAHLRVAQHLRDGLRAAAAHAPDHARALVPGITVGDDRALDPATEEDLRTAGLTHLTAVSGAHVALLLAPILLLTGAWRARTRVVVAAVALLALVVLVRPEPSVVRAAAMGAVTLGALLLGRPAAAPSSLAAVVLVLLVLDPWSAVSYGFVLSVLATGALAALAPAWARGLGTVLPAPAAAAVATAAAAQAVCAPVLVLLDPALSLVTVPANLLAAPAVPWVTGAGVAATLLAPFAPTLAARAVDLAAPGTWWITTVAHVCAVLPGARLPWPGGAPGAIALAAVTGLAVVVTPYVGVRLLRAMSRGADEAARALDDAGGAGPLVRRVRAPMAATFVVALVLLGAVLVRPEPAAGWEVWQCDVGQGAATLIRTGPRRAVLVDTGPEPRARAAHVGDCLRRAGVDGVDLLLLTHTHADHAGGLDAALREAEVVAAVVGPGPGREAILRRLAAEGARVQEAAAGSGWDLSGVRVDVLQGDSTAVVGEEGINGASLVVTSRSRSGARLVVLGDLGETDQDRLARALRRADPEREPAAAGLREGVDVLVVAHHGSADQSRELAELLRPRLALVPVGENDHGHPTRRALDLQGGALVRRTDECGDVAVLPAVRGLAVHDGCG